MSETDTPRGKCPCGWVIPAICTGILTPKGAKIHPSLYTSGTSMLVMMQCPACSRTLRQTAPISIANVMKPGDALLAFEAFARRGPMGPAS